MSSFGPVTPRTPLFSGTFRMPPAGFGDGGKKFLNVMRLMGQVEPGGKLYQEGVRAAFETPQGDVLLIVGQDERQDQLIRDTLEALTFSDIVTYQETAADLSDKVTPW